MALRFHGFEVATASCGAEATFAVTTDRPDLLLLLDVMLPDADGFDLCRQQGGRNWTPGRYRFHSARLMRLSGSVQYSW
nr:hypothetical protein [Frankia sp. AgKG'84/4]